MAIQIRGNQVQDATLLPAKLDLTQTYDFSSGVLQAASPTNNSDVATKAYVDGILPDSFAGGDGISITDGAGTDTIAVDLATDPGLQFTSNKLDLKLGDSTLAKDSQGVRVKLKVESGGSLSSDVNGIYIADGAVANGKLANSTISGVALGSNLNSLSAGQGISMTSYNGSAAVSDITVNIDGSTLSKSASGLKVADDSIGSAQLSITSEWHNMSPDGTATAFDLGHTLDGDFAYIMVFRNGLAVEQVASSPSGQDQFSVSLSGGTGGLSQITFGSAPSASDNVRAFYIAG